MKSLNEMYAHLWPKTRTGKTEARTYESKSDGVGLGTRAIGEPEPWGPNPAVICMILGKLLSEVQLLFSLENEENNSNLPTWVVVRAEWDHARKAECNTPYTSPLHLPGLRNPDLSSTQSLAHPQPPDPLLSNSPALSSLLELKIASGASEIQPSGVRTCGCSSGNPTAYDYLLVAFYPFVWARHYDKCCATSIVSADLDGGHTADDYASRLGSGRGDGEKPGPLSPEPILDRHAICPPRRMNEWISVSNSRIRFWEDAAARPKIKVNEPD